MSVFSLNFLIACEDLKQDEKSELLKISLLRRYPPQPCLDEPQVPIVYCVNELDNVFNFHEVGPDCRYIWYSMADNFVLSDEPIVLDDFDKVHARAFVTAEVKLVRDETANSA